MLRGDERVYIGNLSLRGLVRRALRPDRRTRIALDDQNCVPRPIATIAEHLWWSHTPAPLIVRLVRRAARDSEYRDAALALVAIHAQWETWP